MHAYDWFNSTFATHYKLSIFSSIYINKSQIKQFLLKENRHLFKAWMIIQVFVIISQLATGMIYNIWKPFAAISIQFNLISSDMNRKVSIRSIKFIDWCVFSSSFLLFVSLIQLILRWIFFYFFIFCLQMFFPLWNINKARLKCKETFAKW